MYNLSVNSAIDSFISRIKNLSQKLNSTLLALTLTFIAIVNVHAQTTASYPSKTVRVIVPFGAGGPSDLMARIVAEKLALSLGQAFIVENRPGGSSILGTQAVVNAAPDGYTLLVATSGPIVFNPALYSKLPFQPEKDLTPISMICSYPLIMTVPVHSPAKSFKELVTYSNTHSDKSNYAAPAASIQLAMELLKSKVGMQAVAIPYKGSADSNNAVISGEVSMFLADALTASGLIKGGRVRALVVSSENRMKDFPDVPTFKEVGVDFQMRLWISLFAPVGTPSAISQRLQSEIARIVRMPDVQAKMASMTITSEGGTSEELAQAITAETKLWTAVAKANNIKGE